MDDAKKRKRKEKKSALLLNAEPDPKKSKQGRTVEELDEKLEVARARVAELEAELHDHCMTQLEQDYTEMSAKLARCNLFGYWVRACVRELGMRPCDLATLSRLREDIAKSEDRRHYDYIDSRQPGLLGPLRHPAAMLDQIVEQGLKCLGDARGEVDFDTDHGGRHARATLLLYPCRFGGHIMITAHRFRSVAWSRNREKNTESLAFLTRVLVNICKVEPTWICQQLSAIVAGGNAKCLFPTVPQTTAAPADEREADEDADDTENPMAKDRQLETRVETLEKRIDAVAQFISGEVENRRKGAKAKE